MRSLLKYLKDYKKESILAPVFKMLEASFELFVPLVMAAIILQNGWRIGSIRADWSGLFCDSTVL